MVVIKMRLFVSLIKNSYRSLFGVDEKFSNQDTKQYSALPISNLTTFLTKIELYYL